MLRLDRFFSDERELDAERSRSFLRWRSEVVLEEHASPHLATGLRADLRWPGLNKRLRRLRIVIAGQTREAFEALFPTESTGPVGPGEGEAGTADAELSYRILDHVAAHADLGAGVIVRMPPGAFGRVRLRYVLPVGKLFLARTVATGFWRTDAHLGTSAALEAERPLGGAVVARLGGGATLAQIGKGLEWRSELAFLASLGARIAAQVGTTANGATRAVPAFDRLRVYARARRDLYRRWLFVEVEPGVSWPWTAQRGREAVWAVALRMEVQFQGKERPPPPPPPPPEEPRDPPPEDAPADPLPPSPPPG